MSRNTGPFNLNDTFARLRPDASASPMPVEETFWQDLSAGAFGSFANEFLITTHSFVQNWPIWEMHPQGDEMLVLMAGAIDLVLEKPNGNKVISLQKVGDWLIVPRGVWHTARVYAPSTVLFMTAGEGTQHRQVDL